MRPNVSDKLDLRGSWQLYRRLLSYTWPYKQVFAFAILGMLVTSITEPAFAALMKPMLDGGFVNRDPNSIRYVPLLLVGLFILRGLSAFVADYSMHWVGRRVIYDIRGAMFSRLVTLPTSFFDNNASGALIAKVIYDVEQVANAATNALSTLVKDNVSVIGLFSWMVYLNWRLTLLFLVLIPVLAFLVKSMSHRFRRSSRLIQRSIGDISRVVQQAIEGQRVVKTFGGHEHERAVFAAVNNSNRQYAMKKAAVAASGIPTVQLVAALALAWVVYLAMQQTTTTAGDFVSYITAMMLMMAPLKRLTQVNETLQTGLAAAQSVFALLDEAPEIDQGTVTKTRVQGRIEYRNVGFSYPASAMPALSDVSFTIEPGQTLALVGPSGSGKSTIAGLLPRFYPLSEGAIYIDDVKIEDYVLQNLRSHIAIVSQETVLFDDTVRNNIAYAKAGVTEAELLAAADAAHVSEFVRQMPAGFDTIVGENGVRLSGGQRQRIAIARALLKNSPILILDEATSALDTASERHVQAAMQRLMQDRTTLVIAHRLSTIESADRIVVLQQGRVVESGTHRELLTLNRTYAQLHRMQFNERAG